MLRGVVLAFVLTFGSLSTNAGEAGDILASALASGGHAGGLADLDALAVDSGDGEMLFARGTLMMADGLGSFMQAMYRHGITAPDVGGLGLLLGMPMADQPVGAGDPEPLDHETFNTYLVELVTAMDASREVLETAGENGGFVVPIDVLSLHFDLDGDGAASDGESVAGWVSLVLELPVAEPGAKDKSGATRLPAEFVVGFDTADAFWLAGYTQVIAVQADLLVAHDLSEMFDASFHRIFPEAGLPMQDFSRGGAMLMIDPESDTAIADAIAFIHTLGGPVADEPRFRAIPDRLNAIIALSRRNWNEILAETDDERELVPSPTQTSLVPGVPVTEKIVAGWMATLDQVEAIVAGELLIPHWRFSQGFDLAAYFAEASETDVVMLVTGLGALPFLADGPVADAASFAEGFDAFGDNFPGFALWFN